MIQPRNNKYDYTTETPRPTFPQSSGKAIGYFGGLAIGLAVFFGSFCVGPLFFIGWLALLGMTIWHLAKPDKRMTGLGLITSFALGLLVFGGCLFAMSSGNAFH
jgi:hypothetical protein